MGTIGYAFCAHRAPEGMYPGMGSSLEVAFVGFMIAYFIGVPIVTGIWITGKKS